ncbi:hypothetical protein HU200_014069 [Digitaria exilis]|uniref:Wall-associated receptor kinase galacturonan-binding domain-containing protein n=1 Tax=Digitaria exilis TaxID=1010633 RepID=A0A835FCT2_9POAL|nr:hypothetical protein HU200_014069 [Digitaria exilis]
MCGDVVVPYPFGTTAGCYLPGYNLTCDTSQEPPRLFLGDGTLQVVSISLENSTVRVVGPDISMVKSHSKDYMANGIWGGERWGLRDGGPYILSEDYNELVLSGCALSVELVITGRWSDRAINTCSSICYGSSLGHECLEQPNSRRCQKCSGLNCCQVPVPYGHVSYTVRLTALVGLGATDIPYLVFISEEGWLWFQQYNSSMSSSAIPVVLAWAIVSNTLMYVNYDPRDGNATCPKDLGSTACHRSYNTCRNIGGAYGNHSSYICSCN